MTLGGRTVVRSLTAIAVLIAAAHAVATAQAAEPGDSPMETFEKGVRPFLKTHCFHCHGNGKNKADLALDQYNRRVCRQRPQGLGQRPAHAPHRAKCRRRSARGRRPTRSTAVIEGDRGRAGQPSTARKCTNVGRVTLRRLNRVEYNNTIRDLVGVDFKPAADFPADDVGYGFDNIGDVLSMSPLLLREVPRRRRDDPAEGHRRSRARRAAKTRGSWASASRATPARAIDGGARALRRGRSVRRDVTSTRASTSSASRSMPSRSATRRSAPPLRVNREQHQRSSKSPPPIAISRMTLEAKVRVPTRHRRASAVAFAQSLRRTRFDRMRIAEPPAALRARHRRSTGRTIRPPRRSRQSPADSWRTPRAWSRAKRPARSSPASPRRAFRRPVQARGGRADPRASTTWPRRKASSFEERVRLALCRVLVSPHFLFRVELDPPRRESRRAVPDQRATSWPAGCRTSSGARCPTTSCSRWPRRASCGRTCGRRCGGCSRTRSRSAFVENFAGQWLTLRKLPQVVARPQDCSRTSTTTCAPAMLRETELFFEAIVREDRSILDFLDADFTFVNERLARHYGIDGVKGARVPPGHSARPTAAAS